MKSTATQWEEIAKNATSFLSRFVPNITFSPDKQVDLSFGIRFEEVEKKPEEILNLAENIAKKKNFKMVICIDEFQSIAAFKDGDAFQKKLRSHWQNHQSVSYCLYGSKKDMLMDIFSNPSMPFYKFGDLLFLEKIKTKDWILFIEKRFFETGKRISKEVAKEISLLADNHPFYVQQLAQQSWFRTDNECTKEVVFSSLEAIVDQMSLLFADMIDGLSTSELNFLKAVLLGEKQFTSRAVIEKYKFNSSANVIRIKKKLCF